MNMQYVMSTCLIVSVSLIMGCSRQKDSKEAQKLVDKQAELVKEGREEIGDFMSEMSTIKDSMTIAQKKLADDRKFISNEMKSIEKEKAILEVNREQENLSNLQLKRDSLNKELVSNITLERRILNQIERLANLEDSLINISEVLSGIVEKSETNYKENISSSDLQLSKIESQHTAVKRSINFNERKIDIVNRKIELLQDELILLKEEKTEQLRKETSNEVITSIVAEITGIEKQIATSQAKVDSAQNNITFYRSRLNELDQLKEDLQEEIKSSYESKGIVSEFAVREKEGAQQQVADLQETTDQLLAEKTSIVQSKQLIEQNLNAVEKQVAELETKRLHELQDRVAKVEQEDTNEGAAQTKYASKLDSLNAALTASSEDFDQATEILSIEQRLLTKQGEDLQKVRSGNLKKAIIVFSMVVFIFLFVLYYIGRIKKRKLTIQKQ